VGATKYAVAAELKFATFVGKRFRVTNIFVRLPIADISAVENVDSGPKMTKTMPVLDERPGMLRPGGQGVTSSTFGSRRTQPHFRLTLKVYYKRHDELRHDNQIRLVVRYYSIARFIEIII
jgi:hypothetical protein